MKNLIVRYVAVTITLMIVSFNISFASQTEIFSLDNGNSYVYRNSDYTVLVESEGLTFYNYVVHDSIQFWNKAFTLKDVGNPLIKVV